MSASSPIEEAVHAARSPASAAVPRREAAGVSDAALPCWCGSGAWSLCFRAPKFGLVRCSACGTYQTDPPPLRADTESAEFYTDYYSKSAPPAAPAADPAAVVSSRNAWFWRVTQKVPQLAEIRQSVIDIGSGDGHTCAELHAAGWTSVTGVEISRTRVARARQMYPQIPFYDCPLGDTGIPQESFDLMVMDSVIEHLPNPVEMLRDLRRFLKPGGTIVLLTPNMESGHFRFLQRRWTGMLAPHAHIFLFTAAGLSQLLVRAGFHVSHTGSLHMPVYRPLDYLKRVASGDVKGAIWRAHQEIGGFYGRAIGSGPMLYAVAARP
jgi:SAM-dependent methyltransferase